MTLLQSGRLLGVSLRALRTLEGSSSCSGVGIQQLRGSLFDRICSSNISTLAAEAVPVSVSQVFPDASDLPEAPAEVSVLTPRQVVELLDRNIVGQADAKKAVANALRNRWRRQKVASPLKEDIVPKNILMIGPTGCGKTEIARRLAKIADAPFVKVEATKFTEVGFHGRDVDQIIRDLVENAVVLTRQRLKAKNKAKIDAAVEEYILTALCGPNAEPSTINDFRRLLREGSLEDRIIQVEVSNKAGSGMDAMLGGMGPVQEVLGRMDISRLIHSSMGGRKERKELKVSEARSKIEDAQTDSLINDDAVTKEAVYSAEQDGIVFIDEIDKIVVNSDMRYGADASSEGVQRDLLPIIEGSVVSTKYGNVNTDHMLFICSGAFHSCKPSDMLAELQGRLPVRVELKGLTQKDFYRILKEPDSSMVKQQTALLATEGVELHFTDAAIQEVARVAEEVNSLVDNIGARRLYTILEKILEEISFTAPEKAAEMSAMGKTYSVVVDKELVIERVGELVKRQDLSKYVL